MIFIKDSSGNIIGEIVEEAEGETGCCLTVIVIILIAVASLYAAIGALPEFIEFYLQQFYTYIVVSGIILINTLLFYKEFSIVGVNVTEAIVLGVVLFIHNMCCSSSYWYFTGFEGGFVEKTLLFSGMVWQCLLGALILCILCSVVSAIVTSVLENKCKN